jgi:hypothetical protein
MNTSQKINQIENREDRTHYTGKFKDFQSFGSSYKGKKYSVQYEQDPYSDYQNFLYKRALFGLKMYTQDEIKEMHWQKRNRIKKVHKRTQGVLNNWKQQLMIEKTNKLFQIFFPDSSITQTLLECSDVDPEFHNMLNFKSLGITKRDIVDKLCEENLLPHNFTEL